MTADISRAADVNGRILYANPTLEKVLHFKIGKIMILTWCTYQNLGNESSFLSLLTANHFAAGSLASGHTVSELIPSPHAGMHNKWIQAATRSRCLLFIAMLSIKIEGRL